MVKLNMFTENILKPTELKALLERAKPYVEDYLEKMRYELANGNIYYDKDYAKWLRAEKKKAKQLLNEMNKILPL